MFMNNKKENNDKTTIQVSKIIHNKLKEKKIIEQEPYDSVIRRLLKEEKEND